MTGRTCDTPVTCEDLPCNNGTCATDPVTGAVQCICPLEATGDYCELELDIVTPRFKGTQSYLGYPAPDLRARSQLRIRFRAWQPDGIILFGSRSSTGVGDYVLVQLSQGLVSVGVDCGSGEGWTQIETQRLDDDIYHVLDIKLDSCSVELSVNKWHSSGTTASGASDTINLSGLFYLGGVPEGAALPPGVSRTGMTGCVSAVEIDSESLSLSSPETGMNVDNCDENVCQGVQCSNGGRCVHSSSNSTGRS